jgi:addiction module HigA family antidote
MDDMTLYPAIRNPDRCPTHPGVLLPEIIAATGKNKTEIARLLGISRQHLYDLIGGAKPVSPTVAARLGKLFGGGGPGSWLRMQAAYDGWHAEREVDVSGIPTLTVA